jgi:hypothetical protein
VGLFLALGVGTARHAGADEASDTLKEFQKALRSESWQDRATGYDVLAAVDSAAGVAEGLKALGAESHGAVRLHGVRTLGGFGSPEAVAALADEARRSRGDRQYLALLALERQRGAAGVEALLEVLGGKDTPAAAQAAIALGAKQAKEAIPALLGLLAHKEWQVRAAAAWGLREMCGPLPGPPKKGEPPPPHVPGWLKPDEVGPRLLEALRASEEADRRHLVAALERVSGLDLGYDPAAWEQWLGGARGDAIQRNPLFLPRFFGVPITGKRVVVVIVNNVQLDKPHPYSTERLKELCEVPGAASVNWISIRTVKQFVQQHVARFARDYAKTGGKIEILTTGPKAGGLFGKLRGANVSEKALEEAAEGLVLAAANDTYGALHMALDVSGSKDSVAWQKGPDEVLYVSCAPPWLADVTDQSQIGADLGLKARSRLVGLHTVGVAEHPAPMMRTLSEVSGGVYRTLER